DGIESVNVRTLGSTDTVTVGDLSATAVKTVDVDLSGFDGTPDGAADTVIATGTDGPDNVSLGNADGKLVVNGLPTVTRVSGGDASLLDPVRVATLGGDDTITSTPLVTGSTPVALDGGEGTDTLRFNGTPGDDQIGIARITATAEGAFAPG